MTSILASTSATSAATTSSTSSANILRITGMASGIDTDAVVKSMLSSYQQKIDTADQAEQTLGWQQDAYKDIITGIKGLQDYFDPLSSKYMLTGNSFDPNAATSSNTAVASATVSSSAKTGTYSVNVTQLAEQAKIQGDSKDSMIQVSNPSSWNGTSLTFGSTTITLGSIPSTDTTQTPSNMSDLVANINSSIAASTLNGTVSASYVSDGNNSYIKFIKSNATTADMTLAANTTIGNAAMSINSGISTSSLLTSLGFATGAMSFTINNGTTSSNISLTVDSTTTIQNLADQVNSATSGAVIMSTDDTTGKISFSSSNYGSTSSIGITNASSNVLTNLGISTATGIGKDAIVGIIAPGQTSAITTSQSANKFTINGVNYNLVSTGAASLTVTSNTDTVVNNIKSFITDYNTIISTINTKLTEKPDPNYPPLTDAQKATMSDTQITAWETKAKVGILRNDDNLSNLLTQLRSTLYTPVINSATGKTSCSFGTYGSNAVGIDTTSDVTDGGQLVISDETKLRAGIENNPDDFNKLFIGVSTTTLPTTSAYIGSQTYNEDGLFQRMNTIIQSYVSTPGIGTDGTFSLSGSMNIFVNKQYDYSTSGTAGKNTLPDQLYEKALSVTALQTQMEAASTRYYAQFTALETAMSAMNSQQSTLTAMLGTSTSS